MSSSSGTTVSPVRLSRRSAARISASGEGRLSRSETPTLLKLLLFFSASVATSPRTVTSTPAMRSLMSPPMSSAATGSEWCPLTSRRARRKSRRAPCDRPPARAFQVVLDRDGGRCPVSTLALPPAVFTRPSGSSFEAICARFDVLRNFSASAPRPGPALRRTSRTLPWRRFRAACWRPQQVGVKLRHGNWFAAEDE